VNLETGKQGEVRFGLDFHEKGMALQVKSFPGIVELKVQLSQALFLS
jgi:hypothetical protein